MRYRIINAKNAGPNWKFRKFEKIILIQSEKLDRFTKNYPKPLELEVHISKNTSNRFTLSYSINLRQGVKAFTSEKGEDILSLPKSVFEKFKRQLQKHMILERKEHLHHIRARQKFDVEELIGQLQGYKKENQKQAFVDLLQTMLPKVEVFVRDKLRIAEQQNKLDPGKFTSTDLVDELYLKVYEDFDLLTPPQKHFDNWLVEQAQNLLAEHIRDEDFERQYLSHLEDYQALRGDDAEKNLSVNADGKVIFEEELDDISYHHSDEFYDEETFLYDEEEQWIEDLDNENKKDPDN